MEQKRGFPIVFIMMAGILGSAIYKQFNFQTNTFEKPALVVVYLIAFIISIAAIIRGFRKKEA